MRKTKFLAAVATVALTILNTNVLKAETMQENQIDNSNNTAIVLAAFGTTYEKAQKALFDIKNMAEKEYPDHKIVMSFSSSIIRNILAKQGQYFDSPADAVKKLEKDGYKKIVMQSLQIIPGFEYDILLGLQGKYNNIVVGQPLLSSRSEMMRVLKDAIDEVPAAEQADNAIILVGHGTKHPADLSYVAAAAEIKKIDKNAYFCTVEGCITFDDVVKQCKEAGVKNAYIVPFMSVAGDHAHNDMYGDKPGSLKSLLKDQGIDSKIVMEGLGENKAVAQVWLDHLREAMNAKPEA